MSELIEFESKSRLGRLRQKIGEKRTDLAMRASTKREMRRRERAEIENIRKQERKKLQRRFIRQKEKEALAKKFKVKTLTTKKKITRGGKTFVTETTDSFNGRNPITRTQAAQRERTLGESILSFDGVTRDPTKKKGITLF